jgi:hypothetical protein
MRKSLSNPQWLSSFCTGGSPWPPAMDGGHALVAGDHGESPVQVLSFLLFSQDGGLLSLCDW